MRAAAWGCRRGDGPRATCPPACAHSSPAVQEFVEQIRMMREYDMTTLFVDYKLLQDFDRAAAAAISEEFYRCVRRVGRNAAVDVKRFVPPSTPLLPLSPPPPP